MKHFTNETISPEAYLRDVYSNKDRWVSYYHQISLVKKCAGTSASVLEVGLGNGVVAQYLKELYRVKTVDIIESLKPDYIASVEDMSVISDMSFDVCLCAEVLEHLPFEKFEHCLRELKRVTRKSIVLSLPYWGYTFGFRIRLPYFGTRILHWKLSGIKQHRFNGQHYWELGKRGFPIRKLLPIFARQDLRVVERFWDLDDPYHYYFVLQR